VAWFGRRDKRILKHGIAGRARILVSERYEKTGLFATGDGDNVSYLRPNFFGTRTYWFKLEVHLPSQEPYETQVEFEVPRRAENTGILPFHRGHVLAAGVDLPVRVDPDDPHAVVVDWDAFRSLPGRKQAQRAATAAREQKALAKAQAEQPGVPPEIMAQMRANNRIAAHAWAHAVRHGGLSREEFEETVTLEVDTGRMDPADAAAARASLDGGPAA
jgi:hypothetical protein